MIALRSTIRLDNGLSLLPLCGFAVGDRSRDENSSVVGSKRSYGPIAGAAPRSRKRNPKPTPADQEPRARPGQQGDGRKSARRASMVEAIRERAPRHVCAMCADLHRCRHWALGHHGGWGLEARTPIGRPLAAHWRRAAEAWRCSRSRSCRSVRRRGRRGRPGARRRGRPGRRVSSPRRSRAPGSAGIHAARTLETARSRRQERGPRNRCAGAGVRERARARSSGSCAPPWQRARASASATCRSSVDEMARPRSAPRRRRTAGTMAYQSAWMTVPLCRVATLALALHATMAPMSCQLSIASCQCRGTPAGDS